MLNDPQAFNCGAFILKNTLHAAPRMNPPITESQIAEYTDTGNFDTLREYLLLALQGHAEDCDKCGDLYHPKDHIGHTFRKAK